MLADDLNVFHEFKRFTNNTEIFETLTRCRDSVHRWDRQNRVMFDSSKEHFDIVHPLDGEGEPFKLLGCRRRCEANDANSCGKHTSSNEAKDYRHLAHQKILFHFGFDQPVQESCVQ